MRIPVWLTLAIAILVIGFGCYRLYLAFGRKPQSEDPPRRGLYAMRGRTHLLIGIIYLLLGGSLVATSLGWSPFGDLFGPKTAQPTKDQAPQSTPIPIDQLPPPKK